VEATEEARKHKEVKAEEKPADPRKGKKKRRSEMGTFTPPPPPPMPDNTEDAAQEALRKLFGN
jgi:hypothetical protein